MDTRNKVIEFLEQDVLQYVVHLKMLHAYDDEIQCIYEKDKGTAGIMLLLDTRASYYDAQTYPQTNYVVLATASDPKTAKQLLTHVPKNKNLVFKTIDTTMHAAILGQFEVIRTRAFISYTTKNAPVPCPDVQISDQPNTHCLTSYAINGYSEQEIRDHAQQGALFFTRYESEQPVSTCFCFPCWPPIWEIARVHTVSDYRRRGYARQVVETALNTLIQQRTVPRYQVHEDNQPSIRLAKSLGLAVPISDHGAFCVYGLRCCFKQGKAL